VALRVGFIGSGFNTRFHIQGRGTLKGIACEQPLARNVAEAIKMRDMTKKVGQGDLETMTRLSMS